MRGNTEREPAELVDYEPWAVERLFAFVSQDHVGFAGVNVLNHGGDGRAAFFQFAAEIARSGKLLAVRNNGNQQFTGGVPYTHNGVTNEAGISVFVVGFHVVALHERANSQSYLFSIFVFQKASIGVDDAV